MEPMVVDSDVKPTCNSISESLIPVIFEIVRSVEKDPIEIPAKQRESQECSQKILELQKRLESVRNKIRQLPGIEYSKDEQLQRLENLRGQLVTKQKLVQKYKNCQL